MNTINGYIDHTLLNPTATKEMIIALCSEANLYKFKSVCVHGSHVDTAYEQLRDTPVLVCTVVGFPLGASSTASKIAEAEHAVSDGASEIDMVVNQGWIKEKDYHRVLQEVHFVKKAIAGAELKVIIETSNLSESEIEATSRAVVDGGADFVKTSTGFGQRGASLDDIRIIRNAIGNSAFIKASGGIKNYEQARAFIDAGAHRIGTSSGVQIVNEFGRQ
ncbi:deoxyribose-phosphate aldolase [Robertkochia marina]|uniref:Deoxyribose-phosphate aldolase n=1 Tax=Robertkochia marina TaxID=1227945 RepID=A0A4S3M0N9_9FLAO|nr:deoxyribose-phosphate aldolase [Robertkochia marina]THD67992.1 deoxyribose-phosphate aldolase [Robertkochia marina]TRZ41512.1 deoxyribose-phosphate aldolase [Robertkochia marina]